VNVHAKSPLTLEPNGRYRVVPAQAPAHTGVRRQCPAHSAAS
jgi:hypothetical protein